MGSQGIDSQTVWVSRAELAEELRLGRRRIGQLIEKGIITETEQGIDLHKAIGEYNKKTDPAKRAAYSQRKGASRPARHPAKAKSAPVVKPTRPEPKDEAPEQGDIFDDYNVARARKEFANAERAEITLNKEKGRLISRDEVRDKEFAVARLLRDRILGFPARVANFIPSEAMKSLTEECEALVRELQDAASAIAEG